MEKLIPVAIDTFDKFLPGYKTYFVMLLALGMTVCQMMGYHEFSTNAWQCVGIVGGITWKLGADRKKK